MRPHQDIPLPFGGFPDITVSNQGNHFTSQNIRSEAFEENIPLEVFISRSQSANLTERQEELIKELVFKL